MILQNLAGMSATLGRLRFEGVNCFAKTVNSRGFRETWTGGKLKQGLQEPGYRRSTRTKTVEREIIRETAPPS
ncbi:hypothetical protein N7501_004264 [Penicillium viridicatum]|nr:hypothetical protein N7501_004264 [Penicillium viridicatum]